MRGGSRRGRQWRLDIRCGAVRLGCGDREVGADACVLLRVHGRLWCGHGHKFFSIVWPIAPPRPENAIGTLAGCIDAGRWLQGEEPEALARVEGWISWAYDVSTSHLYWDTSSGEPDRWTVGRLDRAGDWTDAGCATAEYLTAFLEG